MRALIFKLFKHISHLTGAQGRPLAVMADLAVLAISAAQRTAAEKYSACPPRPGNTGLLPDVRRGARNERRAAHPAEALSFFGGTKDTAPPGTQAAGSRFAHLDKILADKLRRAAVISAEAQHKGDAAALGQLLQLGEEPFGFFRLYIDKLQESIDHHVGDIEIL